MPKLPGVNHLRAITALEKAGFRIDTEPEVPEGRWFKRFSGMTVCGEGEWSRGDGSD